MNEPDLKAGGLGALKIATFIIGGLAVAGGGLWFSIPDPAKQAMEIDKAAFFPRELPDGFFAKPKQEEVRKDIIKVTKQKPVQIKPKIVHKKVKPTPPKPKPYVDYARLNREKQIREYNDARRGKSAEYTRTKNRVAKTVWINTDKNYNNQPGSTGRTVASFPVDLSRTITTDRNISAVLIEAINSEVAGKIRAQIDVNVYSAHGRNVLIPAGSVAVGRYLPLGKVGDNRIRANWNRIITPDGINIVLRGAAMADAMGRSGLTGDVDNRYAERLGTALLVSIISSAAQYSVPVNNQNQAVAINNVSTGLTQAGSAILQQSIDLKPIVEIPAGSVIQITPQEDIYFKKPIKKTIYVERGDAR